MTAKAGAHSWARDTNQNFILFSFMGGIATGVIASTDGWLSMKCSAPPSTARCYHGFYRHIPGSELLSFAPKSCTKWWRFAFLIGGYWCPWGNNPAMETASSRNYRSAHILIIQKYTQRLVSLHCAPTCPEYYSMPFFPLTLDSRAD